MWDLKYYLITHADTENQCEIICFSLLQSLVWLLIILSHTHFVHDNCCHNPKDDCKMKTNGCHLGWRHLKNVVLF